MSCPALPNKEMIPHLQTNCKRGPFLHSFSIPAIETRRSARRSEKAGKEFSHQWQSQNIKLFLKFCPLGSRSSHTKSIQRDNSGLTVGKGCSRSVCAALACIPLVFGRGNGRFNFPVTGPLNWRS